jgi:hypothetical protein
VLDLPDERVSLSGARLFRMDLLFMCVVGMGKSWRKRGMRSCAVERTRDEGPGGAAFPLVKPLYGAGVIRARGN